ncbi:hypothetical protein E2C01_036029 [Portunus trituberculatus]|uniref:Uncharacterized protein n=1 Tax=Portunus trituberculatus TaxID=210409 RepID=A0A5B7FBB7_PORTR|nr:hypothetical protein [Portunus trituberculatus]
MENIVTVACAVYESVVASVNNPGISAAIPFSSPFNGRFSGSLINKFLRRMVLKSYPGRW